MYCCRTIVGKYRPRRNCLSMAARKGLEHRGSCAADTALGTGHRPQRSLSNVARLRLERLSHDLEYCIRVSHSVRCVSPSNPLTWPDGVFLEQIRCQHEYSTAQSSFARRRQVETAASLNLLLSTPKHFVNLDNQISVLVLEK